MALGADCSCVLLDNGTVKCWGVNTKGCLGSDNETKEIRWDDSNAMGDNLPIINLGTSRTAQQLVMKEEHVCVLLDNGNVKCWGSGQTGRLGQGSLDNIGTQLIQMGDNLKPVSRGTNRTVTFVAVGFNHSCAILDNNHLKCWGGLGVALGQGSAIAKGSSDSHMGDNLLPTIL